MSLYLLIFTSVVIGYLWGWASCAMRHSQRKDTNQALQAHKAYMLEFERLHPEYRGTKWGRP